MRILVGTRCSQEGLFTRSRNIFASRVADDETFTHLLMVDADIGFAPDVADRLIRSGHDVVGACVPFRETTWPQVLGPFLRRSARRRLGS